MHARMHAPIRPISTPDACGQEIFEQKERLPSGVLDSLCGLKVASPDNQSDDEDDCDD